MAHAAREFLGGRGPPEWALAHLAGLAAAVRHPATESCIGVCPLVVFVAKVISSAEHSLRVTLMSRKVLGNPTRELLVVLFVAFILAVGLVEHGVAGGAKPKLACVVVPEGIEQPLPRDCQRVTGATRDRSHPQAAQRPHLHGLGRGACGANAQLPIAIRAKRQHILRLGEEERVRTPCGHGLDLVSTLPYPEDHAGNARTLFLACAQPQAVATAECRHVSSGSHHARVLVAAVQRTHVRLCECF